MPTRIPSLLPAVLAAVLISCAQEKEKTSEKQSQSGERESAAVAVDTTLAGRYYARALQLAANKAKYDSANLFFAEAAGLFKAKENWEGYLRCYNQLATNATIRGAYDQARKYIDEALAVGLQRLGEQHPEVAKSYTALGNIHWRTGQYDQALTFHERALSIRKTALGDQHLEVADSYYYIGNLYREKGYYDRALATHQKALNIHLNSHGEKNILAANVYNAIAGDYWRKSDYENASAFLRKAISIWQAVLDERHPNLGSGYTNLAVLHDQLGKYDEAVEFFNKSLSIRLATIGKANFQTSITYGNLATTYFHKGEFDRAIELQNEALATALASIGEKHPWVGKIYHNLGNCYWKKGNHDRALSYYNKALATWRPLLGEKHFHFGEVYNDLALLNADKRDYDGAMENLRKAIDANIIGFTYADAYADPPLQNLVSEEVFLMSLQHKAEILKKRFSAPSHDLRDLRASVSTYQLACRLMDQMRNGYKTEGSKLVLARNYFGVYDQAIRGALHLYAMTGSRPDQENAFWFIEKSKGGILLEALSEVEAKQFTGLPDSLLEKERQLRIDLAFYEKGLIEEQLKHQGADSAKIVIWQNKLFDLKQAYDALLQEFEKEHPDYYNLKYQVKTISAAEVQQQLLDDNTTLVEYFTGADSIFIFAITPDHFTVKTSARDSLLERQITQLRQGIIKQDFSLYAQSALRLYQTLLAPIAENIRDKNLIIAPDGALSAIPFEALLTEQVVNGELQDYMKLPYLINAHAVCCAYSATLLQQEQSRKNRATKHDYLAFAPVFAEGLPAGTRGGDFFTENFAMDSSQTAATATAAATRLRGYLPSTKKEVADILHQFENRYGLFDRWFGNKARVYLEREAKEQNLKLAGLGDYRYLHFATHGLVNEKNPKLSGLLLAQEDSTSKEDGILHLGEIYNLNLNADLVVLSACETGLGQVAKGEGIIGLTRGFLYAGAANLLVSLWQVSDVTTADLMVDFYDKMLAGSSKPEALREAKLQMIRRHAEYAKPYYWAPFILVGK